MAWGLVTQALLVLWASAAVFIVTSASNALLRLGTFEPVHLHAASIAALAINVVLLALLIAAWLTRVVPHARPIASFALRHPIGWTTLALLCALGAVTTFGWGREDWHVQVVSAAIILAAAYFFALLAVAWTIRGAALLWVAIRRWALVSPYRTGLATASLLLLGASGLHLRHLRWYEAPLAELRAELDLAPLAEPEDALGIQQAALCVAAGELTARVSVAALPGACSTALGTNDRDGGPPELERSTASCFDELSKETPMLISQARRRALPYPDAEDVTSEAILRTCTKRPPPARVLPYAIKVVQNLASGLRRRRYREVTCEHPEPLDTYCQPPLEQQEQEARLQTFFHRALCSLPDTAAALVRERTTSDTSFRELGRRFRLSENTAKDTFHNAIKKLRKEREQWAVCLGELAPIAR